MGVIGLVGQRGALAHAEAVLLVRHGKAKARKFYPLAQHGVRAHHKLRRARADSVQHALARRALHPCRQQGNGNAQWLQHIRQRGGVL